MLADPTVAKVVFTPPPLVALVIGINTPGLPLHQTAFIKLSENIPISAARSPWGCDATATYRMATAPGND